MVNDQNLSSTNTPVGIDVRTPAGIAKIRELFEAQNFSPEAPPDKSLESIWLSGGLYTYLETGEDTSGQYALFDFAVPPGAGPPAHIHTREDEAFLVLDGEMTFQVNNEVYRGGEGMLVPYTRGDLHAFQNLGEDTARMLVLAAPAGLENLFREAGEPGTDLSTPPAEDISKLLAAAGNYGVELYPEATLFGRPTAKDGGITLLGDDRDETILGSDGSDLIIGRQGKDKIEGGLGDDLLVGGTGDDQLEGGAGNDLLSGGQGIDRLIGGGSQDTFLIRRGAGIDVVTDFGGVGIGVNPSAEVIEKADTLKFEGDELIAKNMLLNQDGADLLISFEGVDETGVRLQEFSLESLENLNQATGGSADVGNILFVGEKTLGDSFDVFDANQRRKKVFNRNSVTFLNNLDNIIEGFENSSDVINGQGGDDKLFGLSGEDVLRGQEGDDLLDGGAGDDRLVGNAGADMFVLKTGNGIDTIFDFEDGIDQFLLKDLTFESLTVSQSKSDTLLSLSNSNETLAVLTGIDSVNITSADFSIS